MNDSHTTTIIRESLTRILENARFASSPQMSAFLRYVVEEAVAGNADRIKAYSVAVDALGKPEKFDAQKDPCVRVLAMRLRECLADYYLEHEEPVVITIPRGSYKPNFTYAANTNTSLGDESHTQPVASPKITENHKASLTSTSATAQGHDGKSPSHPQRLGPVDSETDQLMQRSKTFEPAQTFLARLQPQRWMVVPILLLVGVWIIVSGRQEPASETTLSALNNNETQLDPQVGAASQAGPPKGAVVPLRPRPNLPTIHMRANPDSSELIRQAGIAVSGVLSKFKNLVVVRDHDGIRKADAWPEDYEIKGNAVTVNGLTRVSAELIHAATGAIAYTAAFEIKQQDGELFTGLAIEMIEAFSAQLARHDGPLISDYRQRDEIRPELACLYDLQDQHDRENDTSDHASHVHEHGTDEAAAHNDRCGVIPSLLDNTRISSIMLSVNLEIYAAGQSAAPQERQRLLENATALAEQAESLGPYRADTHALLMRTLRLTGNLDQALAHGARAMELNRFDSEFLRQYADLLYEVDENERAKAVEAMADKLDPLS